MPPPKPELFALRIVRSKSPAGWPRGYWMTEDEDEACGHAPTDNLQHAHFFADIAVVRRLADRLERTQGIVTEVCQFELTVIRSRK